MSPSGARIPSECRKASYCVSEIGKTVSEAGKTTFLFFLSFSLIELKNPVVRRNLGS